MRLLLADALPERAVAELGSRGHEVLLEPGLDQSGLPDRIDGVKILVVRSTKVPRAVFEAADDLALVIRAGAGTNTIDIDAAAEHGVLVANVPGRNAAAVAELTLGLILAIDRRIPDNVSDLRAGRWEKKNYSKADGLLGKTLGIIGLGSVGLCVAERAAGFGMRIRAVARHGRSRETAARAQSLGVTFTDSVSELVTGSDIVSLHVPASPATRHLVDDDFLAQLRPGAIVINTSRGDVVDEAALLRALDEGRVRAGLDVYADEPSSGSAAWTSPLAQHPRVVGTHHIGASTQQAQEAIADGVVEIIDAFASGEVRDCVNLAPGRFGAVTLTVRHLDRVGVLARVLDLLSREGLNVEHMENRIFRGGQAAIATIDVAGPASDHLLTELQAVTHVLGASAATMSAAPNDDDR